MGARKNKKMKIGHFVEGLSSHTRLLEKLGEIRHRGALEASWLICEGEAGFGKSKTLAWLGIRNAAVMVRAKREWTPKWMLNEIAEALGVQRKGTTQAQFEAVLGDLMVKQPLLIVDEIDYVATKVRCMETLRDLTDLSECVLVAGGTKGARETIKAYPQLRSRIYDVVTFGPASLKDIEAMCSALTDVSIAPDLVAEIAKRTQGRLRLVMNAIARVEAFGRKHRGTVTLDAFAGRALTNDELPRPQLVASNNG